MSQNTEESYLDFRRRNPDFKKGPDSAVIVSGGLDSTVLVYDMIDQGYTPHMLSFNYGQRHSKELTFAANTAVRLGLRHDVIDLTSITELISNSALTAGDGIQFDGTGHEVSTPMIEVPEGHYAEDTMKATVVPNRNMIMLSIACGVAVNNKYCTIGMGVHGGDHFIYPDCRPDFISAACEAIVLGNEGFHNFPLNEVGGNDGDAIFAPYIQKTKADIAYRGLELSVPFEMTWSCYKGGEKHCGKCGTCVERLEAIDEATQRWYEKYGSADEDKPTFSYGLDKTEYEDNTFWREAIAIANAAERAREEGSFYPS